MKNIPIYLVYYTIPAIAFVWRQLFNKALNFELIYIALFGVLSLFCCRKQSHTFGHFFFVFAFICYCIAVFFMPAFLNEDTIWRTFAIDMKWLFYIALAYGWVKIFGAPDVKIIYKGAIFLAIILLINNLFFTVANLRYSRYYKLIAECNYDALLIVLGFIMKPTHKYSLKEIFLFVGSIFFSGSLTGSLAIVGVILFQYLRNISLKNIFRIVIFSMPCTAFLYWLIHWKYSANGFDLYKIDRFIFFAQAWEFLKDMSVSQFLFGFTPGVSLDETLVIPEFAPYLNIFWGLNALSEGVYPFYFHSSYIREILVLGVTLFLCINGFFFYCLSPKRDLSLSLLAVVYFIFATSLSVFTITNGAFMFFFIFFSLIEHGRLSDDESKQIKNV